MDGDNGIVRAVIKFFNLARSSAFYHYTPLLEASEVYPGRAETPTPHIPLEDLEMFEWLPVMHISKWQTLPPPGQVSGAIGREIYGAGETTWFALMFEALAEPSDPAVMLLNLDLFDWELMAGFPRQREQSFIAYNPKEAVNLAVKFKALQAGAKYRLQYGERSLIIAADQDGRFTLRNLELAKDEWLHLKLELQGEAFK